jgi:hypothetical protein
MNALKIKLQGVVRGTLQANRTSPETEEAALQARVRVPALELLGETHLEFLPQPLDDSSVDQVLVAGSRSTPRSVQRNAPVEVTGLDQYLFAFEGEDSRAPSKRYRDRTIIAGLAARRIETGDEIWQFERTPLAFIARSSATDFTLVRRAYLLKELSTGCRSSKTSSSSRFGNELVWVKDAKLNQRMTPVIEMDGSGLLEVLSWATCDK